MYCFDGELVIDEGETCVMVAKATEYVELPLPCNLQGLNPRSKVKSHLLSTNCS